VKVRLFIEGGGESRSLHIECREGFRKLLEKVGFRNMPATKACGSRNAAFDDFKTAMKIPGTEEYPVLLVDSEAPVSQTAWRHLGSRDRWVRPNGAEDDQAQLMVQCMETWCVADRCALRRFFGASLRESSLPDLNNLEAQSKDDVQKALVHATRDCGRGRTYEKGRRSFELLSQLDPTELRQRLPHFVRLCDMLNAKL
jgi:hypothetical protein